jgi:hypothetical protein
MVSKLQCLVSAALAVILALGVVLPGAASDLWSIWLYNFETNQLVRVYEDGTTDSFDLLTSESDIIRLPGAFTSSAAKFAYCVREANGQGNLSFNVVDFYVHTTLPSSYELGSAIGCELTSASFNKQDDTLLALGVVNYFPDDSSRVVDDNLPIWELQVFDLTVGEPVYRLTVDDLSFATESILYGNEDMPFMPSVRSFEGDQVSFDLAPYASGGWFELDNFTWNLATGEVTYNGTRHMSRTDTLATGEQVWLSVDESMPVSEMMALGIPFNVALYATAAGEVYPVYQETEADWSLMSAMFIDGGRYIAVMHGVPDGVSTPDWSIIDRAGNSVDADNVIDLSAEISPYDVFNAPGGYVYMMIDEQTTNSKLMYNLITADGSITSSLLWEDAKMGWTPIWVAPVVPDEDFAPFTAVQQ